MEKKGIEQKKEREEKAKAKESQEKGEPGAGERKTEAEDKRRASNRQVKEKITAALFALLKEKPLHEITVTEITGKAQVARVSFYRNYTSKEDVMVKLVEDVLELFRAEIDPEAGEGFYCYENVLRSFRYFYQWREYFVDMYRSNFAALLLESLNSFHESVVGTMPVGSIERYQLYLYMGALFDVATVWLQNGAKESQEEMAAMVCRALRLPIHHEEPHLAKDHEGESLQKGHPEDESAEKTSVLEENGGEKKGADKETGRKKK